MPRSMRRKTQWCSGQEIPVCEAHVSRRVEDGRLADLDGAVSVGIDLELQPQPARYLHLGREAQEAVPLDPLDPPEVDRVADAQVDRIAPATTQPDAAPEGDEQPAGFPEPVAGIPPVRPPMRLIDSNASSRRTLDTQRL